MPMFIFASHKRTEWEGFVTGTQALAAGGTTSFVDMPLNALPATTTKSSLHLKLRSAEKRRMLIMLCMVD